MSGKVIERFLFKQIHNYLFNCYNFKDRESSLKTDGDTYINQLLNIMNDIQKALDLYLFCFFAMLTRPSKKFDILNFCITYKAMGLVRILSFCTTNISEIDCNLLLMIVILSGHVLKRRRSANFYSWTSSVFDMYKWP